MGETLAYSRDVSTMPHWETGFTKTLGDEGGISILAHTRICAHESGSNCDASIFKSWVCGNKAPPY